MKLCSFPNTLDLKNLNSLKHTLSFFAGEAGIEPATPGFGDHALPIELLTYMLFNFF